MCTFKAVTALQLLGHVGISLVYREYYSGTI